MAVNVKRYIINYAKFVVERIPIEFRFDEVIAFSLALAQPFLYVYNRLIAFRDQIIYKLTITPQVVFLEKMLNDRYDSVDRRIYIEDGKEFLPMFIFTKAELQPVYLYRKAEASKPKRYSYTRGEVGQFTFDFVVFVPATLEYDSTELTALVNAYKLASMFFTVKTF